METEYNGLHSLPPDFLLLIPNCSYVLSENESEPFREPQEYEKGCRVRSWSRPLIICPVLRALNPALLFPVAVGVGPVLMLQIQKQTNKKRKLEKLHASRRSYSLLLAMLFGGQALILPVSWFPHSSDGHGIGSVYYLHIFIVLGFFSPVIVMFCLVLSSLLLSAP